MSTGQHRVFADLVGGLVDAREDPAAVRFDAELAAAVTRGEITPDTAKRLRAWQRASVRGVADHVRTVLPAVLAALESARADALARVVDLAAALADASADGGPDERPDEWPDEGPETRKDTVVEAPPVPRQTARRDTPEPTSSPLHGGPSSLGAAPPRLMVADLVPSRSPVVHDPR
jgi:hypothetical protein